MKQGKQACKCDDAKTSCCDGKDGGCCCDDTALTDLSKDELLTAKSTLEKRLQEVNEALSKAK